MVQTCCKLGDDLKQREILYKTPNFIVTPTIGAMGIQGYLLICSNSHFLGLGGMPPKLDQELEKVLIKTREVLAKTYSKDIVIFEHGPKLSCHKGGGCVDHMHLHIVPTRVNLLNFVNRFFDVKRLNSFNSLREIYRKAESSYIFIENQKRERYVCEVKIPLPSQYLRQIIAAEEKRENWDWKVYPDIKTFQKTLEKLSGKF